MPAHLQMLFQMLSAIVTVELCSLIACPRSFYMYCASVAICLYRVYKLVFNLFLSVKALLIAHSMSTNCVEECLAR
ncbi:hypothetical protein IF1G_08668 [Cordyceps javanica]|uniref:Uncharacterized protein n=1 Tax=Cordyceps javanica TaxID=43265 RepID=A0A545UTF8_9HYPO|nr:hypothetical protein IF1G_08668 [Cordyceps javanica]